MKIALLARNPGLYSHKRLREAAEKRGHELDILDTLRFVINMTSDGPELVWDKAPVFPYDAVIPRIGASITTYGCAVLRQFEMKGVYVLNGSIPVERSRDKLRALQVLSSVGVGMPRTSIAYSSKLVSESLQHVGGTPAIIKSLEGTQGIGVGIVESDRSAKSIIQAFNGQNMSVLVQEFVEEAGNTDIRVLIVGDEIVGAMERTGADGDFRSNLHRGGSAKIIDLTDEEKSISLKSAKAMGLNVCGVDFLRSERGPQVMEVNSSPGLEGIEAATEIDIAGKIVEFIEQNWKAGNPPLVQGLLHD